MIRRGISTVALALVCTACAAPQISHVQLVQLDLGMGPAAAADKLKNLPLSVHPVIIDGTSYAFHRYRMNNGLQADLYLLAFENDKLKYWGYVDEFRRYPDQRLNKAIDAALPQIHTAQKGR